MPTRKLTTRYQDDLRLFPDLWHKVGLVVFLGFLLIFPSIANARWLDLGSLALVATVGSVSMMILTGFAGQISLGHAAFLAIGAYTAAILGKHAHFPYWLVLPAAGFVSAAFGLLIGPFALRLKGLYLAIVTVGLLYIVRHLLHSMPDLTGGTGGIDVPMHSSFAVDPDATAYGDFWNDWKLGSTKFVWEEKLYYLFLLVTVITVWFAKNLRRSNTGRAMMAVRDHDLAAAALGVNPAKIKIVAFGISSFFAGVAGAMFGFRIQRITIDETFTLAMSVSYIAMIVLGGIGTVFGAVMGAVAFVVLGPLAELVGKHLPLIKELTNEQQSTLLFSLVVIGFLVVEPLGIYGIWLRIKRYFIAWPFRY